MNIDLTYLTGHDSFYLREGWLTKGIETVNADPTIFAAANLTHAVDLLGIGTNMVKALRYWLEICNVIERAPGTSYAHQLTALGKIIDIQDRFIQRKATIWLLHFHLCHRFPIWQIMFAEDYVQSFDKERIRQRVSLILQKEGVKTYSSSTIDSAIDVFISTYLGSRHEQTKDPEDNLLCPFERLKLIIKSGNGGYCLKPIGPSEIDNLLVYYIMFAAPLLRPRDLSLEDAFFQIRSVFNLDLNLLRNVLRQLENDKLIVVERTAGLNMIYDSGNLLSAEVEEKLIQG